MIPCQATLFSSIPSSNSLVSSRTLEGLFLSRHGALITDTCVASGTTEEEGHRQVRHARHRGKHTTDAKLDRAFVEKALVFVDPKIGRLAPPWTPCYNPETINTFVKNLCGT